MASLNQSEDFVDFAPDGALPERRDLAFELKDGRFRLDAKKTAIHAGQKVQAVGFIEKDVVRFWAVRRNFLGARQQIQVICVRRSAPFDIGNDDGRMQFPVLRPNANHYDVPLSARDHGAITKVGLAELAKAMNGSSASIAK